MKARRAAKREKSEEEAQKELEEKLLKEQAEDSEIDARNALDMEQGGLVQLQEAILNEVEKKHLSEQEVGFKGGKAGGTLYDVETRFWGKTYQN